MTDLDTQLRHYADYLDHVVGDDPATIEVRLDAARAPRPRWVLAAAAAVLVALAGGIVAWRHATTDPRPATDASWTPPTWSQATDPTGAFTAPPGGAVADGRPALATRNSTAMQDLTVFDGRFVGVGTITRDGVTTPAWWSSDDGSTWDRHVLGLPSWDAVEIREVVALGDAIVVTGSESQGQTGDSFVVMARSVDGGMTWTDVDLGSLTDGAGRPATSAEMSVVDARLFLVGRAGGMYQTWAWSTSDLEHWDRSPVGDNGSSAGAPVAAGDGLVVTGMDRHHRAAAWYSADGASWEQTDLTDMPANPDDWGLVEAIADGPSGLVAVGWSGDPSVGYRAVGDDVRLVESRGRTAQWWWSADGRSWSPITVPPLAPNTAVGGWGARVAASADGYLVARDVFVGTEQRVQVLTSADGRRWQQSTLLEIGSVRSMSAAIDDLPWIIVGARSWDLAEDIALDSLEPQPFDSTSAWLGN